MSTTIRKSPDLSFLSEPDGPSFGSNAYDDGIASAAGIQADRVCRELGDAFTWRPAAIKTANVFRWKRAKRGRPPTPVISDRGEWFPSGVAASEAMGKSENAVITSISVGTRCAGREWRHAKPSERAA